MNTTDFDLDINHWTAAELEGLFQLSEQYDYSLLIEKKNALQTNLSYDNSMDLKNRDDIVDFLNKAVNKIISANKYDIMSEIDKTNMVMRYGDIKNDLYEDNEKFIIKGEKSNTPFTHASAQHQLHSVQSNKSSLINPLSRPDLTYVVNVDSCFRSNYDFTKSTDFIVYLPDPINNVVTMEFDMIELPLTYHAISDALGNNVFTIIYDDKTIEIKLSDGNYESKNSSIKHAQIIEDDINAIFDALEIELVYSVDQASGRSIFSRKTGAATVEFTIDFTTRVIKDEVALQMTLGWLLGFRTASYLCTDAVVSEGICNIRGPRYAFVCIDDYQNNVHNNFICPYESSLINKNIITRLNLETVSQSETIYRLGEIRGLSRGAMSKREYFGPVNLQRLHIQLVDEYGRVIDLNNMDLSFVLIFRCLYEY
jgi:hypothetical protein